MPYLEILLHVHLNDLYHRAVVLDFMQDLAFPIFIQRLEQERMATTNRHLKAIYEALVLKMRTRNQS